MKRSFLCVVFALVCGTAHAQYYDPALAPYNDPYISHSPPVYSPIIYAPTYTFVYVPPDPLAQYEAQKKLHDDWQAYYDQQAYNYEQRRNDRYEKYRARREAHKARHSAPHTFKFSWETPPPQSDELTDFGKAVQRVIDENPLPERGK